MPERKRFWQSEDLHLRLLALFLAVVLWFIASADRRDVQQQVTAPVEVRNVPQGLVVMGLDPERVRMTVRGQDFALNLVRGGQTQLTAFVDMSAVQGPGTSDLQVMPGTLPPGTELVGIEPSTVRLDVDRIVRVEHPITIGLIAPPTGTRVQPGPPNPSLAEVEGPERIVSTVRTVMARIQADRMPVNAPVEVPLVALDERGDQVQGVTIFPPSARVTLDVEREPAVQTNRRRVLPRLAGEPAEGFQVIRTEVVPEEVELTLADGAESEALPEFVETEPVNIAGAKATVTQTVAVLRPPGVVSVAPEQVEVRVLIERRGQPPRAGQGDG